MDINDLIQPYTEEDFANAIRDLLPKGKYWQDFENTELQRLITGMAIDFHITHEEVQLSLLQTLQRDLFGWRIADYQSLLESSGSQGTVFDDAQTPNLIKIRFDSLGNQEAMDAFEEKRLPHTAFEWLYDFDADSPIYLNTALTWALEIGDANG